MWLTTGHSSFFFLIKKRPDTQSPSHLTIYPAQATQSMASITSSSTLSIPDPSFAGVLAPTAHSFAVVLFVDIVGFTTLASEMDPAVLVHFLDQFFGMVDEYCQQQAVEKIKTIGDCYMCCAWEEHLPAQAHCAQRVLNVAHQMHRMAHHNLLGGQRLSVRAGMHAGPVISGIIGKTKFCFDIWGDTVNVASRMETTAVPGTTQVTTEVYELLKGDETFVPRGPVNVKGKGEMVTFVTPLYRNVSLSSASELTFSNADSLSLNVVDVLMKLKSNSDSESKPAPLTSGPGAPMEQELDSGLPLTTA